MKAIIMAGGRGERLRPLTDTVPKPMIDINDKPVLEHIINLFKKYGITDFIFTLCYLPKAITSYFGDGSKFNIRIQYIYEDMKKPLGTAGGIALAKKYINEPFIVTSGDILRDLDIADMISYHKTKNSFATLNVYKRYGLNPKSMIVFNDNNQITSFVERPKKELTDKDFVWSNGSFYIFNSEVLKYITNDIPVDFGKDIFPLLLKEKYSIFSYPSTKYFIDIGNFEKLTLARKAFTS